MEDQNRTLPSLPKHGDLLRISNLVDITNRLLKEGEFKIESHMLLWWEELDDIWKEILDKTIKGEKTFDMELGGDMAGEIYSLITGNDFIPTPSVIEFGKILNLSSLEFPEKRISSLEPLAKLTHLTSLYFSQCQIYSLEPLRRLENLAFLDFSYNKIKSIEPLSELVNLREVNLSGNTIGNLEPVLGLSSTL